MRFRFHIDTGKTVYPDTEGIDLADSDVARQHGILLIRNFFLAHPSPRTEVLSKAVLCITDPDGNVEPLPFLKAFATPAGQPVVHCQAGHA